jgi:hypothetical protein
MDVAGIVVLVHALTGIDAALERAGSEGPVPGDVRTAFRDPIVFAAHVYKLAAVIGVLVLMLTKPF